MNNRLFRQGGINWIQTNLAGLVITGLTLAGVMPALAQEKRDGVEFRELSQEKRTEGKLLLSTPSAKIPDEVWLADLAVSLTADKNIANQEILYNMVVTNLGDDDGRDIVFSMAFSNSLPPGLKVLNINSPGALCWVVEPVSGMPAVKCAQSTMPVNGTSAVSVTVANPGNVPRKVTAQGMGIGPDYNGANNTVTVTTP